MPSAFLDVEALILRAYCLSLLVFFEYLYRKVANDHVLKFWRSTFFRPGAISKKENENAEIFKGKLSNLTSIGTMRIRLLPM